MPLARPPSCTFKGDIPPSRRYLPTYLIFVSASDARQPLPMVLIRSHLRIWMGKVVPKNSSSHQEDFPMGNHNLC